jgi:NAD(P)-dependent dehydrogenase (short-subunit alcohol dehydrogenase family)
MIWEGWKVRWRSSPEPIAAIGLASAKRFAKEGARLFVMGRRQAELDAAVSEIGGDVVGVRGDVSKLADLDRLYEVVREKAGVIDVLFANAGIGELRRLRILPKTISTGFSGSMPRARCSQ